MKKYIICLLLCAGALSAVCESQNTPSLVPYPAEIKVNEGAFILSAETGLTVNDKGLFSDETAYLQQMVKSLFDRGLTASGKANSLVIDWAADNGRPEGYTLDITPDKIQISANQAAGVFYALQTLKQLVFSAQVKNGESGEISLPCLHIVDYPTYRWRGLMLDVSRHFQTIEYLKKQVDLLAAYKMNRLHLHLTDDQGWRLEIKQYPELVQRSAWRSFNRQDSFLLGNPNPEYALEPRFIISREGGYLYGGYYTQDAVKELIEYARLRHVEIIPEIDMPGHMSAAIGAFPELSCTGDTGWGTTFSYPLCPCNEATYIFLENLLSEVADLFPSEYIHIGVDEVEKDTWASSDGCKQLMSDEGFAEVEQLQAYFVDRIQKFLAGKGKKVVAWDEVMEGRVSPDVSVTFWRDWIGGVPEKVVNNGNQIIFDPTSPIYFSRRDTSLYSVYHNLNAKINVVPQDKRHLILGAQACVWAEGISSEHVANYTVYPKLLALSEVVWSPVAVQDWESFKQRLVNQFLFLDKEQVEHTLMPFHLIPVINVDAQSKKINVRLDSEQNNPVIYYTLDGRDPTAKSLRYNDKDGINVSTVGVELRAAVFTGNEIRGPVVKRSLDYHKAVGKPVSYKTEWNKAYPAHLYATLTDGYRGSEHYNDTYWQGFTTDIEVVIDMQETVSISHFAADFIQQTGPGVYMPDYVEVSTSIDGNQFTKVLTVKNDIPETERAPVMKKFEGKFTKTKARYVKVFAKNKADKFMFTDEIVIY